MEGESGRGGPERSNSGNTVKAESVRPRNPGHIGDLRPFALVSTEVIEIREHLIIEGAFGGAIVIACPIDTGAKRQYSNG